MTPVIAKPDLLAALWVRAAEEPFGLAIATDNVTQLRRTLYANAGNFLQDIMLCVPSVEGWLFMVRRTVDLQ